MPPFCPWQMTRPLCKVLGCYTELVEWCGRCYSTLCLCCAPCAMLRQGMHYVKYIMYAPPAAPIQLQGLLSMVIDWTPTTGLVPCHIQPGPSHEPCYPWMGRSLRKKHQAKGFKNSIPQRSMYVKYAPLPPVHLQRYIPMVTDWTPTTEPISCQICQALHMGHMWKTVISQYE